MNTIRKKSQNSNFSQIKTIIIHTFQIKETTKALWDKVQINNNNKKKMEKNLNRES